MTNDSVKPAGEAAWSIGTSLMVSIATTVIVVGVLFAAAGWLASPTGGARATRRYMAPTLRLHAAYVYTGLAILVCFYFLTGPTQGLRTFLTTLIIAGMAAFGIHELRKQTDEEFPDATYDDAFGRTRDKVVTAVKDANIPERVGEQASKLRLPEKRRPEGDATRAASRGPHRDDAGERRGRPPRSAWKSSASCATRASSPKRSSPPRRPGSSAATPGRIVAARPQRLA